MARVFLEVAPGELTLAFRMGRLAQRAAHAPMLRGAAVLEETSGEAVFFPLQNYHQLWRSLRSADEIVTWNGNRVALLVLHRLFGPEYFRIRKGTLQVAWAKHVDLCQIIERDGQLTHRISLSKAIKLTFGEQVAVRRPAARLSNDERRRRCLETVVQIRRLWNAYRDGEGIGLQNRAPLFHPNNTSHSAEGNS